MESWMEVSSSRADPSGISELGAHPPLLAILFTSSPVFWWLISLSLMLSFPMPLSSKLTLPMLSLPLSLQLSLSW